MTIGYTDLQHYTDIANAIREQNGESTKYKPEDMAAAIAAIEGGGDDTLLKAILERTVSGAQTLNVETLGMYAMSNCPNLTDLTLPEATALRKYSVSSCSNLVSFSAPKVKTVEDYAFRLTTLATLNLPVVETLGYGAFSNAGLPLDVKLPTAKTVGNDCFRMASSGLTVSLMGAETIGSAAFLCSTTADGNMYTPTVVGKCVLLGPNVTKISTGYYPTFKGLELAIILATTPPTLTDGRLITSYNSGTVNWSGAVSSASPVRSGWPTSVTSPCQIYVPDASLSAYQSATNWSLFMPRVGQKLSTLPAHVRAVFPEVEEYM